MTVNDIVISVKDLTKKFGNFTAVDHITFVVRKGEIFGFLGANGAGKTTAMRMLCGLSYPTSGDGKVDGYDIITQSEDVKKHIGYMSQKFSLYENLTVSENIRLFCTIYGMSNKEIAGTLKISERTVKNHISNIFKKIDVSDRTQAAVFAIRNNLIKL